MLLYANTMAKYELLYTLPAKYTEEEISAIRASITTELTKLGISISRNDEVGKIKLGYPMQHIRHGHYVLVVFEAEAPVLSKINEFLRLHNEILRHQVVHFNPLAKPISALADPEVRINHRETVAATATTAPRVETGPALTPEELDKRLSALEEDITKSL